MIGIKRHQKVEGWAVEVADQDAVGSSSGIRQRLADNNKLWILCFVVILGLSLVFIRDANRSNQVEKQNYLPVANADSYDPGAYADFAAKFAKDPDYKETLLQTPEFTGPDRFRLLVPGDVSRDEIEYVSRMAASSISHQFKHRVTVQVYMQRASGSKKLVAYTTWDAKKGYAVKFKDDV